MTKRSLAEYIRLDEELRAAWCPVVKVPPSPIAEAGHRRHTPWRAYTGPDCRALVEERHLVLHHDFHEQLRGWLAE